jgi:peptidoglycan/LPS O-acetylase OafA/YrhL
VSKAHELRALTSVRGIAAWAVVLYHVRSAPAGLPQQIVDAAAKGYLAVDFFFLLSGFVIWLSWADRVRGGGTAAIAAFLQRRIARIWPLHLAMLGFGMALAAALALTGRADPVTFPPAELPLHLLLLQNWGLTSALTWNDPAWSISCELAAYLLFPLLALGIDWRRVPAPMIVAAVAALFVLLHAIFAAGGATTLGDQITRLGVVRCLFEFAAGGAVAAMWLRWRDRPLLALPALGLSAMLFASGGPETLIVPFAFAALLLALALTAGRRGNPLEHRALYALGEASYATYLSHYLLWIAFKLAFIADPTEVPAPLMAGYAALVLAASFALYRYVELPAQAWVNGLRIGSRAERIAGRSIPPAST